MLKLRPMGAECDRPPGPLAPHRSVLPHGPRMPCAFCLTLALGARRPCPRPCPDPPLPIRAATNMRFLFVLSLFSSPPSR